MTKAQYVLSRIMYTIIHDSINYYHYCMAQKSARIVLCVIVNDI